MEITCSRNMATLIAKTVNTEPTEQLVFTSTEYDANRCTNLVWITATSEYWALAKIEALGTIGTRYTLISLSEYRSRKSHCER